MASEAKETGNSEQREAIEAAERILESHPKPVGTPESLDPYMRALELRIEDFLTHPFIQSIRSLFPKK